jgi:hypothetical protein
VTNSQPLRQAVHKNKITKPTGYLAHRPNVIAARQLKFKKTEQSDKIFYLDSDSEFSIYTD